MGAQMHLVQMLFNTPNAHTILGWAHEDDDQLRQMGSFSYWRDLAQRCEAACLDGIFFADTPAAQDQYNDDPLSVVKWGASWPTQDPFPVVAAMAAATKNLGFGVTLSVNGTPPYLAVRRLSTLDYLSGGRIGWNIVTGHLRSEHRAIGGESLPHDERYDFAQEYIDICKELWGSISDEAFVYDRETGVFADTSKIGVVDYEGKYLKCRAVPPTFPSAQGHPVIFQAGSSGRGMEFAVQNAEVVFAIQSSQSSMEGFLGRLGEAAKAQGRPRPPVLFGLQPVIAGSEEEARKYVQDFQDRVPLEAVLSRLSGTLGIDLSKLDPDKPLGEIQTEASQGMLAAVAAKVGGKDVTLREIAYRPAGGIMHLYGPPEKIADEMIALWRATGCHGFNISPTTAPKSIIDFVEQVVPILQDRGVFRREYSGSTFRESLQ